MVVGFFRSGGYVGILKKRRMDAVPSNRGV